MVKHVLKIGGSLLKYPSKLKKLCLALSQFSQNYSLIIIPGGGKFADLVRKADKQFYLNQTIAHKMAILAVDQYGFLLSNLIPQSRVTYKLSEATETRKTITVFLPSRLMFNEHSLETSWNLTSDSIAAYLTHKILADKLILVKDVDGIFNEDPKTNTNTTLIQSTSPRKMKKRKYQCVDQCLPDLLWKFKIWCCLVNGCFPNRILNVLGDRPDVYSTITV